MSAELIKADLVICGATFFTMNDTRDVIEDGAMAIAGDRIVAIGKRAEIARMVVAKESIDASRFVVMPGFMDCHIHITGDPLTRGFKRGEPGEGPKELMSRWSIPIFRSQTAGDEAISAQCAALAMMRQGTTCFMEAGTVVHLDAVMEALDATGMRGRVGQWVEGRARDPADQARKNEEAIAILHSEVERYPESPDSRLAAWPILVGHSTNSDEVWQAAVALAREHGIRVSAHMSPRQTDPDWFLANYNRRPLEHLDDIGVLGEEVCITHLAAIDQSELDVLARTGTNAILCPHAALQGAMGITRKGLYPEMLERGVNLAMGTDGVAANILGAARLFAYAFRDSRDERYRYPPDCIIEMATLHGTRAMGLGDQLGSLAAGKKADFIFIDTWTPDWGGVFDPVYQLGHCAQPGPVHSLWIDGERLIEDGRSTRLDEEKLLAEVRQRSKDVIARTELPLQPIWPMT